MTFAIHKLLIKCHYYQEEMKNSPGNKFDEEEVEAIYELGDANGDDVLGKLQYVLILEVEAIYELGYANGDDVLGKLQYVLVLEVEAIYEPDFFHINQNYSTLRKKQQNIHCRYY